MHNNDTAPQVGALRAIVVGVDPSPTAKRALATAIVTARRFGVGCHVVHSWTYPMMAMTGPYAPTAAMMDLGPEEREWLARLVSSTDSHGVDVTSEIVHGHAGPALVTIAAALDAPFLFVGSVGHGAILASLLGSVSQYCVHHATCPVVVVPPADRAAPRPTLDDAIAASV
ncbi:MAG: hypothetical protein NVS3B21_16760 [Acidimicrobiales bacterium]